jgi:hypothetical protein
MKKGHKNTLGILLLAGSLALSGNVLGQNSLEYKLNTSNQNSTIKISEDDSIINEYKNELFSRLKPEISNEMQKYPFEISEGYGGSWETSSPIGTIEWDNYSDLNEVTFKGVKVRNKSDQSTIVHEYFHGIWDIFGVYSSGKDRLINREQFREDTEKFMQDKTYKYTTLQKDLGESWGMENNSPERMKELKEMFPNDYEIGDKIPQVLTERFASLSEIYAKDPNKLPDYLARHFKHFFK